MEAFTVSPKEKEMMVAAVKINTSGLLKWLSNSYKTCFRMLMSILFLPNCLILKTASVLLKPVSSLLCSFVTTSFVLNDERYPGKRIVEFVMNKNKNKNAGFHPQ